MSRTILPRIGREFRFDNKRMREELGITPKELNQTLIDTAYSLIENGFVKKKCKQNKAASDQTNATVDENSSQPEKKEAEEKDETKEDSPEKKDEMRELEPEDKPERISDDKEVTTQDVAA